jgi:hypothetical protein
VFPSLSGKKPEPLAPRFSDLKKSLVKGNEDAVVASWQRLTRGLEREIEEIRAQGCEVCVCAPAECTHLMGLLCGMVWLCLSD